MNNSADNNLKRLNYSKKWLELGLLTADELTNQIQEFENSDDKYTEHYRYRVFKIFLETKQLLDDNFITRLLDLIENEVDKTVACAMTVDILKKQDLSEKQFETVAEFLTTIFGSKMNKYVIRQKLFRERKI